MEQAVNFNERQLVVFELAKETYGVDISRVQEIIRFQEITKVPKVPDFIEGVINLRGNVIPVIDLRKRFDFEEIEKTNASRIIVVEVDQYTVGMVVDAVSEVVRVNETSIEPPSNIIADIDTDYLSGVCKFEDKLIILLELSKVLSASQQAELASVG